MIPKAHVKITLKHISGLTAASLSGARRPYVLARIGGRLFGRSRPVPTSGGDFDLTQEPLPWANLVAADGGDIQVSAEVWDDRGDAAPRKLAEIKGSVLPPYPITEINLGTGPQLVLGVEGTPVPLAAAFSVPVVSSKSNVHVTLRPVNTVVVEFLDIAGLYAPLNVGKAALVRSERRTGYASEDHQGRVYLNRDLSNKWNSGRQQIQLTVRITPTRGAIPKDAKVRWRVLDVADPSNDHPEVHEQAGRYLDSRDYTTTGDPTGSAGGDNEGAPSVNPPWEEASGYALASKAKEDATTEIVRGQSQVLLHCPSTAGDNFIVAAEVEAPTPVESFGARTGVITMWHRIDVESIRMKSALPLPTDEVAPRFEPAFVQMDFTPDRKVPDRARMAHSQDTLGDESAAYVNSVFRKRGTSGWFCMVSAMEPNALPEAPGSTLFTGKVKLGASGLGTKFFEYFEIPGAHAGADYAELTSGEVTIGFGLEPFPVSSASEPATRCWIYPHDLHPEFTAGDGSTRHSHQVRYFYSPRFRRRDTTVESGGYNMGEEVQVEVMSAGVISAAGISPLVRMGNRTYFAGRTIVFSHNSLFRDDATGAPAANFKEDAVRIMVHELTHAFGMPHKCGNFDFRTPRAKTCCMNYWLHWMADDARNLVSGTEQKVAQDLCARHVKEIRRVRLDKNRGLAWK